MMLKYSLPMLAILMLAVTAEDRGTTRHLQPINESIESTNVVPKGDCKLHLDIRIALQQLSSGEYNETQKAKNTLQNVALKSNACRRQLVRALIENMDKPNLDFEKQPSNYYLWREGSQLLGELKATEAIDLLISHLDRNNGFHSSSMAFQPAVVGVRQMGQAAIPKLSVALQENRKARIRLAAVYCLTSIGGESAMNALRRARQSETNHCVANFITVSLNTFSYKSNGSISFDNEAPQANAEARRTWLLAFQCLE